MNYLQSFENEQNIGQLEKQKGGYFFLTIEAEIVNQFEKKRHTRLVCVLDEKITFRCGLNHLGDGNFFVIVAGKYLEQLNKKVGSLIHFKIEEDTDQLGVDMPEVLSVLLDQDEALKGIFDKITDGKKRSLIYSILKSKDIDKQVQTAIEFLTKEQFSLKKKLISRHE
jgi:Domain of unknown function (DUF1905)